MALEESNILLPITKKNRKNKRREVGLLINFADKEKYNYASRYIKVQALASILFGWQSAAILENICQWTDYAMKNKLNYYNRNGHFWTRRSFNDLFCDHFGMMSVRTLKERVKYLESIGVLISYNFNKTYEDSEGITRKGQTKWYRVELSIVEKYALEFHDYIEQRINCFYCGGDPYPNALACIGSLISNGMGFIIFDYSTKKVDISLDVIRAYGSLKPQKLPKKSIIRYEEEEK